MLTSTGTAFQAVATVWANNLPTVGTYYGTKVADFNGDGKDDYTAWVQQANGSGNWYVSLSNGTSFSTTSWLSQGANAYLANGYAFDGYGDFTGDGKVDAVIRSYSTGTVYVLPSTGAAFVGGYSSNWGNGPAWTNVRVADVDGDGKADMYALHAPDRGRSLRSLDRHRHDAGGAGPELPCRSGLLVVPDRRLQRRRQG